MGKWVDDNAERFKQKFQGRPEPFNFLEVMAMGGVVLSGDATWFEVVVGKSGAQVYPIIGECAWDHVKGINHLVGDFSEGMFGTYTVFGKHLRLHKEPQGIPREGLDRMIFSKRDYNSLLDVYHAR